MTRLSQRRKLQMVLALSLLASFGGVLFAVCWGVAADGGRGGAIAVALSFVALFAGRNTDQSVLELRKKPDQPAILDPGPHASDPERFKALRSALAVHLDTSQSETGYLVAASVIGTLFWGFGDLLALALGAPV